MFKDTSGGGVYVSPTTTPAPSRSDTLMKHALKCLLSIAIASCFAVALHAQPYPVTPYYYDGAVYHFGALTGKVTVQIGSAYTMSPNDCGTELAFTNKRGH